MSAFSEPTDVVEATHDTVVVPIPGASEGTDCEAQVLLRKRDGTLLADITTISYDKKVIPRLNRPRAVSFRVPSDSDLIWTLADDGLPYLCTGYRQVLVYLGGVLWANTIPWALEDEGDEDMVYTRVTCFDPMMFWPKRTARDPDGDFTDPTFIKDNVTGPAILQALLDASENAGAGPPDDAEGPLFLDWTTGNWPAGGVSLKGVPTNFPMTIGEIAGLMTNSGQLDIIITPVDDGEIMGRVDTYHGDYGVDLTASVHLDYATGSFNASGLRRVEDMTDTCNKIWKYLAPRQDLQHWRANVTGDDRFLPGNDLGGPGIGGKIPGQPFWIANPLGDLILASREGIGVLMEVQTADDQGSSASVRPLQRRLWQMESLFRANPRRTVYLTPVRPGLGVTDPVTVGDFDVGDLIAINVGSDARETVLNMVQRIYSYEIEVDDDGVCALGELEASPDLDQI